MPKFNDTTIYGNLTVTGTISGNTATTTVSGLMSATDKSKLDGIETGAQVNTVTSVAGKFGPVVLDAGDISFDGIDTNYLTAKTEVEGAIKELDTRVKTNADNIALKQNKLIAGENITIDPITNEISATGGSSQGETWLINDNPYETWMYEMGLLSSNNILFTSFGSTFNNISIVDATVENDFELRYVNDIPGSETNDLVFYLNSQGHMWVNEEYRTITFETAPTGDLLTWLQANAVKQTDGGGQLVQKINYSDLTEHLVISNDMIGGKLLLYNPSDTINQIVLPNNAVDGDVIQVVAVDRGRLYEMANLAYVIKCPISNELFYIFVYDGYFVFKDNKWTKVGSSINEKDSLQFDVNLGSISSYDGSTIEGITYIIEALQSKGLFVGQNDRDYYDETAFERYAFFGGDDYFEMIVGSDPIYFSLYRYKQIMDEETYEIKSVKKEYLSNLFPIFASISLEEIVPEPIWIEEISATGGGEDVSIWRYE